MESIGAVGDAAIPPIVFTDQAETRYDRQQMIAWWDQERLSRASIIVVGAGALGNEVLKLLALIGVGQVTVIDFDVISPSNLARMVLFRAQDVGQPKVKVAVERLREINPEVAVRGIYGDLRFDLGLGEYRAADLVIGCLDSVNARWALNRKCFQAGVEWIDGGISDHHGLVACYSPAGGACYECNFTATTLERFNQRYSCPFGLRSDESEQKVPTTALTTSAIASLQVQQALLMLHGIEEDALQPGERIMLYLKPFRLIKDRLPYNPECLAHTTFPAECIPLDCTPQTLVGDALAQADALSPGIQGLELNTDFIVAFHCPACDDRQEILRLKEKVFHHEARCPSCGETRQPQTIQAIMKHSPYARLRLEEVGVPVHDILRFISVDGVKFFQMYT